MSMTKGKQCDFCKQFIGDVPAWSLNLVFDSIPARFDGQKGSPHVCAECVARLLDALGCAVDVQPRKDSAEGEIEKIVIRSYRRT